ncbi:hypothetical protein CCUS01_16916 [Colletotrichum cuscutae]|uniref:Uncharacterized protein n=1 Tax=Colletotrichum cuscutae TaxID=1209917 RepID=A0AAI9VBA2_9PEZI|nr:hypothetical protein CCUS01_16916 [Colletotrichum cuscutae]
MSPTHTTHSTHPSIHPRKSTNQTPESLVFARLAPLHPFVSSILRLPPPPLQSFQPITNRDLRSQLLAVIVLFHRFPLFAITAATISRCAKLPRHISTPLMFQLHTFAVSPPASLRHSSQAQLYMEKMGTLCIYSYMDRCSYAKFDWCECEWKWKRKCKSQPSHRTPLQLSSVGWLQSSCCCSGCHQVSTPGPKVLDLAVYQERMRGGQSNRNCFYASKPTTYAVHPQASRWQKHDESRPRQATFLCSPLCPSADVQLQACHVPWVCFRQPNPHAC